ncbi:MAG: hypothetical protein JST92_25915, partial [Deltaproteobacteria bacterium]|nr:hypothetical protein [Deltaproteobacteria bacterium]
MSSFARRGLVAALLVTATLAGCKCGTQTQSTGCSSDDECIAANGGNDRWYCNKQVDPPICAEAVRECDSAADCCPSQICNLNGHFCADKFTECTGPGSCPLAGMECKPIGVSPHKNGCTFEHCGAGNSCADGTVCFNGYCVGEPPCGGGCTPSGGFRVCVTATNYCSPAPKNEPSCNRSCPNGQMLVLTNPDNIFDTCTLNPNPCECDSLPPLVVRDVARHSSMALSGANLYVSAYDGQYGDLVVHTYDKSNLSKPTKSEWIDGVPATGTIGGDINGPRHGITNPGVDVGEYTSIAAAANGDLYISYYDVTNGDLKFASRYGGTNASWNAPITIDGSDASGAHTGDVGMYSSIALTSTGVPAIAYFRRGSLVGTGSTSTET